MFGILRRTVSAFRADNLTDWAAALTALSPLDGRYAARMGALRALLSEAGFMRHRVQVEVEWLIALSDAGMPELPGAMHERFVRDLDDHGALCVVPDRSCVPN